MNKKICKIVFVIFAAILAAGVLLSTPAEAAGINADDQGYILDYKEKSKIAAAIGNLPEDIHGKIFDSFGNEKAATDYIATGDRLATFDSTGNETGSYTFVISGDLSGDGRITAIDYILVKRFFNEGTAGAGEPFVMAGDINRDSEIMTADYIALRSYFTEGMLPAPCAVHAWDDGVVSRNATCTEDGIRTFTCTVCDAIKTESIPAPGHSWNKGRIEKVPTCTETGIKRYLCSVCDATKLETVPINPDAHDYVWDHDEEEPYYQSCGITRWWVYYWPYPKTDPRSFDNSLLQYIEWRARNDFSDEVTAAKQAYADFIKTTIPANDWKKATQGFGETGETAEYLAGYHTIHYYKCSRCGSMQAR